MDDVSPVGAAVPCPLPRRQAGGCATLMEPVQRGAARDCGRRCRFAFSYSIDGDLRFISHHDTLRLFRRALARADLPVRFTEGFNPHPRIMIPLPRPVGIASEAETVVVEFEEVVDPEDALDRLEHQTPSDLKMIEARSLQPRQHLRPTQVRYRLEIGQAPPADLAARVRRIVDEDVLEVERSVPESNRTRTIDVRPYILEISMDRDAVEFILRVTGAGTAKPVEIAGLLGYDTRGVAHRIRRMEVRWQQS
jgi:radical SAM-linked protein